MAISCNMKHFNFFLLFLIFSLPAIGQQNEFKEKLFTNPFTVELHPKQIKKQFGFWAKMTTESVPNQHYPDQIDTIFHIRYRNSNIHFYKADKKVLLYDMQLKNRRLKLMDAIHTGMKKQELHLLHPKFENRTDTVIFKDTDQTVEVQFIFNRRERLEEVKYKSLLF